MPSGSAEASLVSGDSLSCGVKTLIGIAKPVLDVRPDEEPERVCRWAADVQERCRKDRLNAEDSLFVLRNSASGDLRSRVDDVLRRSGVTFEMAIQQLQSCHTLVIRRQEAQRRLWALKQFDPETRVLMTGKEFAAEFRRRLEIFRELGGHIDDDSALLVLDSHLDSTYSAALCKEMPHLHDSTHSSGWSRMDMACATLVKLDSDEMVQILLQTRAADDASARRGARRLREVSFAGREPRSRSPSPVHCYACGRRGHISTFSECPCYGMSREESRQWRRRQAAGEQDQQSAKGSDQPSREE